jgi:hypothetical protein
MQDKPHRRFADIFDRQSSQEQCKLILDDQSDALAQSSHQAIVRSRDLLKRTTLKPARTAVEIAAYAFAVPAPRSALMPVPDGVQIFIELEQKREAPPKAAI